MSPKPAQPGTSEIRRVVGFLRSQTPEVIPVDARNTIFRLGYCWYNAQRAANDWGGDVVHGWLIWETDDGLLAQHHTVWKTPDGPLVDVTPNDGDFKETLFSRSPQHPFDYARLGPWSSVLAVRDGHIRILGEKNEPIRAITVIQFTVDQIEIEEWDVIQAILPGTGASWRSKFAPLNRDE